MKTKILLVVFSLILSNFYAQNVGVNATGAAPHVSAMLDVESNTKGLLIPRVDIVDLTTDAPIVGAIESLLVYNTNATSGVGYYFWDGTNWTKLSDANTNSDNDWHEVGGTTAPNDINDDIFTMGKVGIGVDSPRAMLDVNNGDNSYGTILATANEFNFTLYAKTLITNPIYSESFRLGLKHGNNENNGFLSFYRGSASDGGWLGFASNGLERMSIVANGNVGIGTNSPSAKTHLFNEAGDTELIIESDPTNTDENDNPGLILIQDNHLIKGSVKLLDEDNIGFLGTPVIGRTISNSLVLNTFASTSGITNGKIDFATNDTVRMSINGTGGNVGIGVSIPSEKLEVQGSVKIVDGTEGAGKVLTSDAAGKGTWVLPIGSWTGLLRSGTLPVTTTLGTYVVNFGSALKIPATAGGTVSAVTDNMIVPTTGLYEYVISGWANSTTRGGTSHESDYLNYWRVDVNGVQVQSPHYPGSVGWGTNSSISGYVDLTAGDIVNLKQNYTSIDYSNQCGGVVFSLKLIQ